MEDIDIGPVLRHYGSEPPDTTGWVTINCINPKHDDNNASARTNGIGYMCMACGLKGNAITLIMKIEGVTFDCAIGQYESLSGEKLETVPRATKHRRKTVSSRERSNTRDSEAVPVGVRRRPNAGT